MLTVVTLGPQGTNHDLVAQRYLRHVGATAHDLLLADDFDTAASHLLDGRAQAMLQCAAHPDVARIVGTHAGRLHVVDSFIAPGQPLALLVRTDVAQPSSVGLHPATRHYTDLSRWPRRWRSRPPCASRGVRRRWPAAPSRSAGSRRRRAASR